MLRRHLSHMGLRALDSHAGNRLTDMWVNPLKAMTHFVPTSPHLTELSSLHQMEACGLREARSLKPAGSALGPILGGSLTGF